MLVYLGGMRCLHSHIGDETETRNREQQYFYKLLQEIGETDMITNIPRYHHVFDNQCCLYDQACVHHQEPKLSPFDNNYIS